MDDWQTTLDNHTGLLNAIRADHLKQRETLADHGERLERLEKETRDGFKEMRDGFKEMRNRFGKLAKGQELITDLLTRHLPEPGEETHAGGADE